LCVDISELPRVGLVDEFHDLGERDPFGNVLVFQYFLFRIVVSCFPCSFIFFFLNFLDLDDFMDELVEKLFLQHFRWLDVWRSEVHQIPERKVKHGVKFVYVLRFLVVYY